MMGGAVQRIDERDARPMALRERLSRITHDAVLLPALQNAWSGLSVIGARIAACAIDRVHARPDGGFVVSLDAQLAQHGQIVPQLLIAEIPANGCHARFAELTASFTKSKRCHQIKHPTRPLEFCMVPELDLVARFAGFDEKLDGLDLLHAPNRLNAVLPDSLIPQDGNIIHTRLLAHRLHRRAVIEARIRDSERILLKVYRRRSSRPRQNASLVRFLEQTSFQDAMPARVPKILGLLPVYSGFIMAEAGGQPLNELHGGERLVGMALAGEALARLHRVPLRLENDFTSKDEAQLLSRLVDLTAAIFPALRKSLGDGLDKISVRLAAASSHEPSVVHRDFHERQIIVDGSNCTLIDFDTVCNGDPHQDIGNFLAHLDLARLQGIKDGEESTAAFLEAYTRAHRRPLGEHVAVHRQSTLLRLACIYAFSTRWRRLAPNLIEMALQG